MSKASEYAERVKAAENNHRPEFRLGNDSQGDHVAAVNAVGNLIYLRGGVPLFPAQALAFAAWIQETFGKHAPQEPECEHKQRLVCYEDGVPYDVGCADCSSVKP